jgi:aryl-alcohol dehydrogenase-like predicted oxidoreductase
MRFPAAERMQRVALGCAQFGAAYGIANRTGQLTPEEGARVLALAAAAGMDTLDTAVAYGESEARLGAHGVARWRVVSKLPPLPADLADVGGRVMEQVAGSLARLRIPALDALLLHRSADLLGPQGEQLRDALLRVRDEGSAGRIGVSIYAPEELERIVPAFRPEVVQAPFSVLDRRLERSGWLARLADLGVEVHVRSVFLQGLLLQAPEDRAAGFAPWQAAWDRWDSWLQQSGSGALAACLGFVLARPEVHRVVVGVDGAAHLAGVLAAAAESGPLPPADLACDDLELIEPFRWTR